MRTLLICHKNERINFEILPRWLASFSDLAGIVVIDEPAQRLRKRIKREVTRVGYARFLDVLAFRAYYSLFLSAKARKVEATAIKGLENSFPRINRDVPIFTCSSPNSQSCRAFIESARPDLILARCKFILKEEVFGIARIGTFVLHPGICPEYRNAHGCFWALANGDFGKVGATLLKIDKGIDTGPVYCYLKYPFDSQKESHVEIQMNSVFRNLDPIRDCLVAIGGGGLKPIDTSGRTSAVWGQPWLTKYLKIRMRRR